MSVKDVPDARIERPTDVLEKITTTNNLTTPDDPRTAGAAYGFAFDPHPDRLSLVEQIGAIPIHDSKGPIDQVKHTNGLGADRGCACVGYQAHDPQGIEHPDMTLNNLVQPVKFTGTTGVVGVFIPQGSRRPGPDVQGGRGRLRLRQLYGLIRAGKAEPSWIVSHELVLNRAADGYTDTSTSTPATTAGRRSSSPGGQLSLTARRHALGAPSPGPAVPVPKRGTRTGPAGCPRRSHRTTSDS
ncbi:hypothetical protein [Streptomyces asiaticus]